MANITWVCDGGAYYNIFGTVTLVSNTTKTQDITVLPDEAWLVTGGYIHNGDNVARLLQVQHYLASGDLMDQLVYAAAKAANTYAYFPWQFAAGGDTGTHFAAYPIVMTSLSYIRYTWTAGGVSAGGPANYVIKYKKLN